VRKCFYCSKEGNYVVDENNGMWFLCKTHYQLFLAKHGKTKKKRKEEE